MTNSLAQALALTTLLALAPAAEARDTGKPDRKAQERARFPYEGPSGKRYQYDLSNPGDQIRYDVDPAAQLRDSINVDPRIDLDRDIGRPGGGASTK